MDEESYKKGMRDVYLHLLRWSVERLGYDPDRSATGLILEREAALVVLRRLCDAYGDSDWTPEMHLADILEQHLERRLDAREAEEG